MHGKLAPVKSGKSLTSLEVQPGGDCTHTNTHTPVGDVNTSTVVVVVVQMMLLVLQFSPSISGAPVRPEQDPFEGLPELGTEDGVDDWIER